VDWNSNRSSDHDKTSVLDEYAWFEVWRGSDGGKQRVLTRRF
jgi:hypothetical protein